MRRVAVLASVICLLCAALLPGTARTAAEAPAVLNVLEAGVLTELNNVRVEHGLKPLKPNAQLGAAATQHSTQMLARGYFAHESPDGSAFWKRIREYYPQPSYGTWAVGENLIWSAPSLDPKKAVELWMASPGHRKNILAANWREIGIGAVTATGAGTFGGRQVTVITTDFGVRRTND
jgi:uncharacterized protein YkwD